MANFWASLIFFDFVLNFLYLQRKPIKTTIMLYLKVIEVLANSEKVMGRCRQKNAVISGLQKGVKIYDPCILTNKCGTVQDGKIIDLFGECKKLPLRSI